MKVQSAGLLLGWISDIPNPGERNCPTSFSPLQERRKKKKKARKPSHNQSLGRQIGTTVFVFSPSTPLSRRGLTLQSTVTTHKYLWVLYCKQGKKIPRKVTVKSLVPLPWKAALCTSINLLCKWSLKLRLVLFIYFLISFKHFFSSCKRMMSLAGPVTNREEVSSLIFWGCLRKQTCQCQPANPAQGFSTCLTASEYPSALLPRGHLPTLILTPKGCAGSEQHV